MNTIILGFYTNKLTETPLQELWYKHDGGGDGRLKPENRYNTFPNPTPVSVNKKRLDILCQNTIPASI